MKKYGKKAACLGLALVLTAGMSMSTFAGEWKQDTAGYWYQNDDGSYVVGWQWVDGKCYYFAESGYMLANTTTPDGFTVDESGAWVVNGVVQTQDTNVAAGTTTNAPTSQEIINHLSNDKIDGYVTLVIDDSKAPVTSGATNIKRKNPTYKNGWTWHVYYKYASSEYFVCALAFDENGYLLVNTTTPDGYQVNEYGMLVINGQPVVHSSRCKVLSWSSTLYDNAGRLVTDKNNVDLSTIDVLHREMSIGNYLDITPFGSLVYNHCQHQDATGDWSYGNGFGDCVEAQKALYFSARQ